jgi:hypothetical protein
MKTKQILIILCLFCTSAGFAQNKLFDKYADMDDVTSVYISKAMFQMMPNIEKAGVNLANVKGKIESLQLVSTEKPEKIAQMKKDFSVLVTNQHQELMRVKDGKSRVNFYSNGQGDQIKELLMLIDDENNFTAILINGNFTLKDIQEIADKDGKE